MHGRERVGLGDHQRRGVARNAAQRAAQAVGAGRCAGAFRAQDAEARGGLRHERSFARAALQPVVAVAQEHEVRLGHPVEQVRGFGRLRARRAQRRVLAEFLRDGADALPHGPEVLDRDAHVGKGAAHARIQRLQMSGLELAIDFVQLPGFALRTLC